LSAVIGRNKHKTPRGLRLVPHKTVLPVIAENLDGAIPSNNGRNTPNVPRNIAYPRREGFTSARRWFQGRITHLFSTIPFRDAVDNWIENCSFPGARWSAGIQNCTEQMTNNKISMSFTIMKWPVQTVVGLAVLLLASAAESADVVSVWGGARGTIVLKSDGTVWT
jgi:hypothetical protein